MITNRTEFVLRYSILGMLSDDEVASVTTAETAKGLSEGDEYLDLQQLERGVRSAGATCVPMACVLSRRAVRKTTWSNVLAQLDAYRTATLHFGIGRGTCTETR
jgi:hypothetical protein